MDRPAPWGSPSFRISWPDAMATLLIPGAARIVDEQNLTIIAGARTGALGPLVTDHGAERCVACLYALGPMGNG